MYVELYVDYFFECFCGVRYDVRVLTVYPYAAYRMPAGSRAREHASTRPGWVLPPLQTVTYTLVLLFEDAPREAVSRIDAFCEDERVRRRPHRPRRIGEALRP